MNQRCKVNLHQQLGGAYGHRMEESTWEDTAETMDVVSHAGSSAGGTGLEDVMETFRRYSLAEEACHWVRLWSVAPPLPVPCLLHICGWKCDLLASSLDHLLPGRPHHYGLSMWNHVQTKINSLFSKSLLVKGVLSQQKGPDTLRLTHLIFAATVWSKYQY